MKNINAAQINIVQMFFVPSWRKLSSQHTMSPSSSSMWTSLYWRGRACLDSRCEVELRWLITCVPMVISVRIVFASILLLSFLELGGSIDDFDTESDNSSGSISIDSCLIILGMVLKSLGLNLSWFLTWDVLTGTRLSLPTPLACSIGWCFNPRAKLDCSFSPDIAWLFLLLGIGRFVLVRLPLPLPLSLLASKLFQRPCLLFVGGSCSLLSRSTSTPRSRAPDNLTIWCNKRVDVCQIASSPFQVVSAASKGREMALLWLGSFFFRDTSRQIKCFRSRGLAC